MNQNLHKLIGTKMKSGNKGVRGMSTKNMETFIRKHATNKLKRVQKKDRMTLGRIFAEFKEGKNKLEEGRSSPKKPASPKKNNFNVMMKKKTNWANMNNNSNLGSLPASPASSKSSVSGYGSSPNEGKNFFVKPIRYRNTFAFNQAPKKGSVNIFPVKGHRKPLSKVPVLKKRVVLTFTVGGNQRAKPPPSRMYGKFPKENEYNAPVGKSMGRKGVVSFNTTHFRPLRSNSPPKRIVAPSISKKAPFVLRKFLESIKSKK